MLDVIVLDKTRAGNNYKLELGREATQSGGFKLRRTKLNI